MAKKPSRSSTKLRSNKPTAEKSMPHFEGAVYLGGADVSIVSDSSGGLYRIDVQNGTIRKLRWEQ